MKRGSLAFSTFLIRTLQSENVVALTEVDADVALNSTMKNKKKPRRMDNTMQQSLLQSAMKSFANISSRDQ